MRSKVNQSHAEFPMIQKSEREADLAVKPNSIHRRLQEF